jgi:hypothetical protein
MNERNAITSSNFEITLQARRWRELISWEKELRGNKTRHLTYEARSLPFRIGPSRWQRQFQIVAALYDFLPAQLALSDAVAPRTINLHQNITKVSLRLLNEFHQAGFVAVGQNQNRLTFLVTNLRVGERSKDAGLRLWWERNCDRVLDFVSNWI